jgi:predicted S18 family serine protease
MKNKLILIMLISICIIIPLISSISFAQSGHLKLLAVTSETKGVGADLDLRIMPGTGSVFIATSPLTKMDTQLSTRFAKDIACKFLEKDCSNLDFFYTITSNASIVGGPSAGAAISALTIALLEGYELNEIITITGTINSGGLVGSVGGLKPKIEIAAEIGLKKVLIPFGERFIVNETIISLNITESNTTLNSTTNNTIVNNTNTIINDTIHNNTTPTATINNTIDLYEFGKELGVEVIEVSNLYDVMFEFTNITYEQLSGEIIPDDWYIETMKNISNGLCERSNTLKDELNTPENTSDDYSEYSLALNLTQNAESAISEQDYYSAASFCFGAAGKFSYLLLKNENMTNETTNKINEINNSIELVRERVNNINLQTITDIQTYVIVNERLTEAEDTLIIINDVYQEYLNLTTLTKNSSLTNIPEEDNSTEEVSEGNQEVQGTSVELEEIEELEKEVLELTYNLILQKLAYSTERVNSAVAWSSFFNKPGSKFNFSPESIHKSCIIKQKEVEERINYIQIITLLSLEGVRQGLDDAKQEEERGNFIICLFKASKAKAEADTVMSMIGTKEDSIQGVIDTRLALATDVILKQQRQSSFPIFGYSYYEYAKTLQVDDTSSALIYSHYALELSNLDMYFEKELDLATIETKQTTDPGNTFYFIIGFVLGILLTILYVINFKPKNKKK